MEEFEYFFSYTRGDSEFVLKLAKQLRAVGTNVWLDQLDILGGQHWDSAVESALKTCHGMIAVLSPEAVESKNVMDEVSYALEKGKLVVPVLLCSCDIPFRLRRVQHIDFTGDYDTGFSQLLRALHIQPPSKPTGPKAPQEAVVPDVSETARPGLADRPGAVIEDSRPSIGHSPAQPGKTVTKSRYRALKILGVVIGAAVATFSIFATLSDTGVFAVSTGQMTALVSGSIIISCLVAIWWFR